MSNIIEDVILYWLFAVNFIVEFIKNPCQLPRDLLDYLCRKYKQFIKNGVIVLPIIGPIPFGKQIKPGKTVKFDKTTEFKTAMEATGDDFGKAYETIRQYFLGREEPELSDAVKWMDKVIQYNVPNGKKRRGLILATSYKYFAPDDQLTDKNIELSCILGWCVEILHASMLVVDDIMDQASMRRGQPCWYLNENVGNMAINDAILLQHSVFQLLKHYFSEHKCYIQIAELTRITSYKTAIGTCIDSLTTPKDGKKDFSQFTTSRYATIVKYKVSLHSFGLPVRLALLFAGIKDEKIHEDAEKILNRMGYLFESQDDFIDCFGDADITGTHIEEGKCSYMAVEALKRMSDDQLKTFKEHYGNEEEVSTVTIKLIYEEVDMKTVYAEFEENELKEIRKEIAAFKKRSNIEVKPLFGILVAFDQRSH